MIRTRKVALERVLELRRIEEAAKRRALGMAVTALSAADGAEVAARRALDDDLGAQRELLGAKTYDARAMRRAAAVVLDRDVGWKRRLREREKAQARRDRAEIEYREARARAEALEKLIARRVEAERVEAARRERRNTDEIALARHVALGDDEVPITNEFGEGAAP